MDRDTINRVSTKVFRQFPEVKGEIPKVSLQRSKSKSLKTYLLVYSGKAVTADNKNINRIVRVLVNEKGKILKLSTSR